MSRSSGRVIAALRNRVRRLSGRRERPAYVGFMVTNTPVCSCTWSVRPTSSMAERDASPCWIACTCCETLLSTRSSSRLNSSKQPNAPTRHTPRNRRPIAWKSNCRSQLKTSTRRPSAAPSALTVSVLPVPAGPKHSPKQRARSAWVSVRNTAVVSGVCTRRSGAPRYSNP